MLPKNVPLILEKIMVKFQDNQEISKIALERKIPRKHIIYHDSIRIGLHFTTAPEYFTPMLVVRSYSSRTVVEYIYIYIATSRKTLAYGLHYELIVLHIKPVVQ